jgi:hypothetical protein
MRRFFKEDLVRWILHFDRGFTHSLKSMFSKPGRAAINYLEGHRVRYLNPFAMLLVLLSISILITPLTTITLTDLTNENAREMMGSIERFATKYPRTMMLATIPIYALMSALYFRKARLNFAEHLVLNSFKVGGEMVISLLFSVSLIFITDIALAKNIYGFVTLGLVIYAVWFYYNAFSYLELSKVSLFFRALFAAITFSIAVGVVTMIITIVKLKSGG